MRQNQVESRWEILIDAFTIIAGDFNTPLSATDKSSGQKISEDKSELNYIYAKLLSRVLLFATPWTAVYQAPVHSDSPGKNTGVGCHALLQGIFPTQGSNPGLPHSRQILLLSEPPDKSQMYIIDVRCT